MLGKEISSIFSIGLIMAFRMLGLFMILPVFSVAAKQLTGSTPMLIGMALGVYGLTQAVLQIPFGSLSDKWGRKPIILLGLILFAIGSIFAANASSIYGIIIGRAIQGGGAIGATALALVADLTRDENRTKAMAIVGMMIGLSFSVALLLGPIINSHYHLSGIFWVTAGFALLAMLLLIFTVPTPKLIKHQLPPTRERFRFILTHPQLLRFDASIFFQHAILTAYFIAIPLQLAKLHVTPIHQTWLYLGVLACAFLAMIPFVILAEKKRKMKSLFIAAVLIIGLVSIGLSQLPITLTVMIASLFLFFTAFNFLESCLPSLVSKAAPLNMKGTAMGVYSTSQFFGIFVGGCFGGVALHLGGISTIYGLCLLFAVIWCLIVITMSQPRYLSTLITRLPQNLLKNNKINEVVLGHQAIEECYPVPEEGLLHLKVDKQKTNINELRKWLEAGNLSKLV